MRLNVVTMLSRFVRRTHMYVALALCPWVLMYALSTLAMNHRRSLVGDIGPPAFAEERRMTFDAVFPPDADLRTISRQVLDSLDLAGAHAVTRRPDGAIVITRNDLLAPRRITVEPAAHTLVIERQEPRVSAFLERFHRRRGYATGYAADTAWAVTVDLFIAAMVLWAASGLWMWWELKTLRLAGAVALLSGAGLFSLFLFTI